MQEVWVQIAGFPVYSISNLGRVINNEKGWPIRQSLNTSNILKVGLVRDHIQYTRSVKVLVAQHFVSGHNSLFNTPIQKDGDTYNCRADNLVYRPRWFAMKHAVQFHDIRQSHRQGPVREIKSGDTFENIVTAAIHNGLLFVDVLKSIRHGEPTFPTRQLFEIVHFD